MRPVSRKSDAQLVLAAPPWPAEDRPQTMERIKIGARHGLGFCSDFSWARPISNGKLGLHLKRCEGVGAWAASTRPMNEWMDPARASCVAIRRML